MQFKVTEFSNFSHCICQKTDWKMELVSSSAPGSLGALEKELPVEVKAEEFVSRL